jgi:alcohol dehydrogenase class IV
MRISLRGRDLAPRVALLDAELGTTAPPRLTIGAGLNALAHCVEAMYSRSAQPMSSALALGGAELLGRSIPSCVRDPSDLAARQDQLLGSAMSSLAFASAMLGLHAAFTHAISAVSERVLYTDAQCVIFPLVLRFKSDVIDAVLRPLANAMDLTSGSSPSHAIADWSVELGGPTRLRDIGVRRDELERMSVAAFNDRCVAWDPRTVESPNELSVLFSEAW